MKQTAIYKQKGLVLVTGMIFLLIVSLACFTSLENIRFFTLNDGDQIRAYQNFYLMEDRLLSLEDSLLQTNFTLDGMADFFSTMQIVDNANQGFSQSHEQLWQQHQAAIQAIQKENELEYLQEFLGFRHEQFLDPESGEVQEIITTIIRISVWHNANHGHAMQAWLQLVPEESKAKLETLKLESRSKRIAWSE